MSRALANFYTHLGIDPRTVTDDPVEVELLGQQVLIRYRGLKVITVDEYVAAVEASEIKEVKF